MRPARLAVAALVLLAFLPQRVASGEADDCFRAFIDKGETPVLLVHGFAGNPGIWEKGNPSIVDVVKRIPTARPVTFDYVPANRQWVTHARIGSSLADCIESLSALSSTKKIVIVTHSMGGLAVREAGGSLRSGTKVSGRMGLVINLGTPHLGSWWAGVDFGRLNRAEELLSKLVTARCELEPAARIAGLCGILRDRTTPGARAMKVGSSHLTALPKYPSSVPVLNLAGRIKFRVPVFGLGVTLGSVGDVVVSSRSATAYSRSTSRGGGEYVDECVVNALTLWRARRCWQYFHGNLPTAARFQSRIENTISQWIESFDTREQGTGTSQDDGSPVWARVCIRMFVGERCQWIRMDRVEEDLEYWIRYEIGLEGARVDCPSTTAEARSADWLDGRGLVCRASDARGPFGLLVRWYGSHGDYTFAFCSGARRGRPELRRISLWQFYFCD